MNRVRRDFFLILSGSDAERSEAALKSKDP